MILFASTALLLLDAKIVFIAIACYCILLPLLFHNPLVKVQGQICTENRILILNAIKSIKIHLTGSEDVNKQSFKFKQTKLEDHHSLEYKDIT